MFFKKRLLIAVGVGLATLGIATPCEAIALTNEGDTTGQPTWLRTIVGNPPDQLSGQTPGEEGVIVPYSVYQFMVEQSGLYTFGSAVPGATSAVDGGWDNFLVLYQDSFSPTAQLTNILVAGKAPNNGSPVFNRQLTAGQNYFLVTTGRRATDFGAFTNTIARPDEIVNSPPAISAFTYKGDTTGTPTWFRTAPGDPPDRVSGQAEGNVGALVTYSVFQFGVDRAAILRRFWNFLVEASFLELGEKWGQGGKFRFPCFPCLPCLPCLTEQYWTALGYILSPVLFPMLRLPLTAVGTIFWCFIKIASAQLLN